MKQLQISDDFSLPIDAVTQTFAILAKRGVGKSYTASVMAEEMLKAGQQIVAIDPTGAWWGLRSMFPVVVFGGEHGDVPLEHTAGELIATAIVENRFPAVIDLSLFSKGKLIAFMTAFAETFYRLNREPVHLFVDEADAVAPQARNYGGDENRMLGAMEDIVRRGRKRGIGCTLITQRPAVLNKNVLTQCEVLVALRLVHPKDIDAIEEWVNVHADPVPAAKMIASLPSLPVGTAWFWSPGWGDFFRQVKVRERETFDSGVTPKPGQAARSPKKMVAVDVEALGAQIKATVEKAKANDPNALRKRVADLERQLATKPAPAPPPKPERIEVPVLKNGQLDRTEKVLSRLEEIGSKVLGEAAELRRLIAPATRPAPAPVMARPVRPAPAQPKAIVRPVKVDAGSGEPLGKAERRILTALAQYPDGRTKTQVAVLAAYAVNGGGFKNALGALRSAGRITGDETLSITEAGLTALGSYEPLPHGQELLAHWHKQLGKAEKEIIDVLVAAYPDALSREEIAARSASQYEPNGGGFKNALGRLRTFELIKGKTELTASDDLFDDQEQAAAAQEA